MLEDVVERFLCGDLPTCDFCKDIYGLAEVFGKEVAAELHLEPVNDAEDGFAGMQESIVVTGIGDDDVALGGFGGCINELLAQMV